MASVEEGQGNCVHFWKMVEPIVIRQNTSMRAKESFRKLIVKINSITNNSLNNSTLTDKKVFN